MKTNRKENRYVDGKIEKIKLIVRVNFFFFASRDDLHHWYKEKEKKKPLQIFSILVAMTLEPKSQQWRWSVESIHRHCSYISRFL
jgi:hypothetical protein